MADVVRTGAISRVKKASPMRSPMPRLPVARSRIASATPETPAAKRGSLGSGGRVRSALERVVPRVPVALPRPAPSPTTRAKGTTKGVAQRKPLRDDASVRASFNRLVSESETRRRVAKASPDSSEEEEDEDEEKDESASDEADKAPQRRGKGRKRPRAPFDDEPGRESDENGDLRSEELVTPQPHRRHGASSGGDEATSGSDDDSDGVQVQKRLMYDDTPPAKPKMARKPKDPSPETTSVKVAASPVKRTRGRTPKKVAVGGGSGLEILSLSSAATPSRSTRIRTGVLVMSEWYVDWPPGFVGDQLQLVVRGQVLGQPASFTVQRRVTDEQFVSTDNQNVRLNGCLDIDLAQRADVPPVVMELLVEGIPTNWRQLLEAYAPPPDPWVPLSVKSKEKAKQKNAKAAAAAAAEAERMSSVSTPGVKKSAVKKPVKSTPAKLAGGAALVAPSTEKRSRSGRRLTPVMEWWRNERKVVDANFESKIIEGSPAYLPSNRTKMSDAAKAARQKIQEIYEAQRKSAEWSDAQLTALHEAKVQVPTTHINFWGEVAKLVPGKTADECRARSFDDLPVAPARKGTGAGAGRVGAIAKASTQSQVPVKIHRAGSNLFKKQVRQFVHDQEQKNVDDLFSFGTPSKDGIGDASELDDLKSPGAPMAEPANRDGDDSDDDALLTGAGRELLEKVSLSKRDDVDSYVRTLKRANESLGLKAVRTNKASTVADFETPPAKKKPRREAVQMVAEVGTHTVEAIVTPNGTTRVRVALGSDQEDIMNEDEDDEEAALSDAF